jgi:hypothetical protein
MEMAPGRPLEELAPGELEALWEQAKRKLAQESAADAGTAEAQP